MPVKKKVTSKKVVAKKSAVKKSKKQTFVALVIDRSGSMELVGTAAVSAINEQIGIIKKNVKLTGETFVSFIQFHNDIEVKFDKMPAKDLQPITAADFRPEGTTAMYDALGVAIENLKNGVVETDDTAYLIVLVSDGQENASKIESQKTIAKKTAALQKTGKWTFTAMLSNVDVTAVANSLHIPVGNTTSFVSTIAGLNTASSRMSGSYQAYSVSRGAGSLSSHAFYSDNTAIPIGSEPVVIDVTQSNPISLKKVK